MLIRSRREFLKATLRSAVAIGAGGVMSKFAAMNAFAQSGSSYQAMVCIFLSGGNDGHNTVVPIATVQQNYSQYALARGGLAIPQSSLLTIPNGADTYGLHPSLPEIQALYLQQKAAVLANVGMLVQPFTNKSAYQAATPAMLPQQLFSHSDQTGQWQTAIPTGLGGSGWGGRIADVLQTQAPLQNSGAKFPSIAAVGGCGQFCTGVNSLPASVPPPYSAGQATGMATLSGLAPNSNTGAGMQQLLSFDNGLLLVQAGNTSVTNGSNYANTLTGLLPSNKITTAFPANNPLASQLLTVANVMSVQSQLGLTRQIFFCSLGGFDTHSQQTETQTPLLQQLSQAVNAFYTCVSQELNTANNVVTFTASEFGRTLSPSGSDGSDHAWGSHHFVIGGGVLGGKIYGNFPSLALGGPNDANTRGTLIPSIGVDQYGSTIAQWFGVNQTNLATVFPNIGNYSLNNLGFLT
ncbi:MAG TPA: DUF1501 domain-containing protein [Bryobacteraceae bacterium]|jgi:uncharacterized protein (DUF1501 family)|nr:DUF1501 domain-containing protein [Bryobacteraceae bacterium]